MTQEKNQKQRAKCRLFARCLPACRVCDIFCIVTCSFFISFWLYYAQQKNFFRILCAVSLVIVSVFFLGDLVLNMVLMRKHSKSSFPINILCGYTFFSIYLFIAGSFGFDIAWQFCGMTLLIILLKIVSALKKRHGVSSNRNKDCFVVMLCVIMSLIGATLWSQISFNPITVRDNVANIAPWVDGFYHSNIISMISRSGLVGGMKSILCIDGQERLYHYASYTIPAVLVELTGISSFFIYNAYMVPLGLFFIGLSAFSLIKPLLGNYAGLAAIIGLLFIPDASHHGMNNPWFGFHWLVSISPGLSYGISCAALAWVSMLKAIKDQSFRLIFFSYVMAILCIFFRAQIFVAIAYLIFIYPFLFYKYKKITKVVLTILASLTFCLVLYFLNTIKTLPSIILNFSASVDYIKIFVGMTENQNIKAILQNLLSHNFLVTIFTGVAVLLFETFGIFIFLYILQVCFFKNNIKKYIIYFPAFVVINYVVMSLGLAYNKSGNGMPEELLHRPFVWSYFIVSAFSCGLTYFFIFKKSSNLKIFLKKMAGSFPAHFLRIKKIINTIGICFLLSFILTPLYLGKNVQKGPEWAGKYTNIKVPLAMLDVINYIRIHSNLDDVIQDSDGDKQLIISGLSGRISYVTAYSTVADKNKNIYNHLAMNKKIMSVTDSDRLLHMMRSIHVVWYVLHPDTSVAWPNNILLHPAFEENGYRVYHF